MNDIPAIYTSSGGSVAEVFAGRTEDKPWGAWRVPDKTVRHYTSCFDVELTSNEIGARDASFNDLTGPSLFLIGDSFAEGFGVSHKRTSQYLLEEKLGMNILNFGAAGDFGPLQQLLIYQEYQDDYAHEGVIIYILPANDFFDNDANFWAPGGDAWRARYRPYFSEEGDPLVPWYFPEAVKRNDSYGISSRKAEPVKWRLPELNSKRFMVDYLWMANVFRSISWYFSGVAKFGGEYPPQYYDSLEYQQENLLKAYSKLIEEVGPKDVLMVVIPSKPDIRRFLGAPNPEIYKNQLWYKGLGDLAKESNVFMLDLMDHVPDQYIKLFFSCDDHWSSAGNEWAADTIDDYIVEQKVFSN